MFWFSFDHCEDFVDFSVLYLVVVVTPEAAPGEVCGEAADRKRRVKSEEAGGSPTVMEKRGR